MEWEVYVAHPFPTFNNVKMYSASKPEEIEDKVCLLNDSSDHYWGENNLEALK